MKRGKTRVLPFSYSWVTSICSHPQPSNKLDRVKIPIEGDGREINLSNF